MFTLPHNKRIAIQSIATLFVAAVVAAFVAPTRADVICYPDMAGATVSFESIVETSLATGALYGNPSVAGNTINFPATGFAVQGVNNNADFINGRLDMTIVAGPGELIDSLTFEEMGTFFLQGPDAMVISSAIGMVNADGSLYSDNMYFDSTTAGSMLWSDSMTINFAPTDEVHLVFDSRLFAFAAIGGAAFIDKTNIAISVGTISAVPEPMSGSLTAGFLLVGLFAQLRIRRHSKW